MANVFYTWFGPPAKPMTIAGNLERPEFFGLRSVAQATHRGGDDPTFIFCCLEKYADRFRSEIGSLAQIMVIERELDMANEDPDFTVNTPFADSVGGVLSSMIWHARDDPEELKRRGAFLKDVWSLYVLWKHGGYHLDCGCHAGSGNWVSFPEPGAFGTNAVHTRNYGKSYRHYRCKTIGSAWPDFFTAAASLTPLDGTSWKGLPVLQSEEMPRPVAFSNDLDVWGLRSPRGDSSAADALSVYVLSWYCMKGWGFLHSPIGQIAEYFRRLIVVSVVTGVAMNDAFGGFHPRSRREIQDHLMLGSSITNITDLNICKEGYQTHRAT